MSRVFIILVALIIPFLANEAYAAICEAEEGSKCLYVSPSGNGVGTYENPGSFQSLIPQLSRGDYLYMLDGVYTTYYTVNNENMIINLEKYVNFSNPQPTADQPVTIKGYPGADPIISGDLANKKACIKIDGISNLVMEDFKVRNCYNSGLFLGYDVPEENITFRNLEFYNIEYNDNSGFLTVHSYENVVIEDSVFHDYIPKSGGQVGGYIKLFRAKDVTIRNNEFYGAGEGIHYKHGETTTGSGGYTKIYNNNFHDLSLGGIHLNQNRAEVYNNLFLNTVYGINVHREDGTSPPFTLDVNIHHNTFVDSGGVTLNQGAAYDGTKGATIANNVFYNSPYNIWRYGTNVQYNEGIDLTSDNNCFYDSSGIGNYDINFFGADNFGNLGDVFSFSDWQDFYYEGKYYDQNSYEINPQLDDDYLAQAANCQNKGLQSSLELTEPDLTPPSAVTNLESTTEDTTITISWDAATDNVAISHYKIYRNGVFFDTTTELTYSGLSSSNQYTVSAIDTSDNEGPQSNSITATTPVDTSTPATPSSGGGGGGGGGSSQAQSVTDSLITNILTTNLDDTTYDSEADRKAALLARIAELQQLIATLVAQLQAKTGGTTTYFTHHLDVGDEEPAVKSLQIKLNSLGFTIAPSGAGSPGNETNYFGPRTTTAIKAFQCYYNIVCSGTPETTGYGNFGPATREVMNGL